MKTVTAIPLHSIDLLDRVKKANRYVHFSIQTEEGAVGRESVALCHARSRPYELKVGRRCAFPSLFPLARVGAISAA